MSTIKSSAENLTLNADGSGNDVIIQSNGSTVATVDGSAGSVGIGTTSTTAKLEVQKSGVVNAQISNATNGHYFGSQSDDSTDGFEIYQQHGTNTTRNNFIVNDNRTGSKSSAFRVRNDGLTIHGGGLTFNGETAAANTLDDYEEGTFTPTLTGSGTAASYTEQAGNYTKIGNLVHVTIKLSCSKGSLSGGVYLDSLPFSAGIDTWGMKFDWYQPYGTALLESGAFFNAGASKLSLYGLTAANNDATAQQFTDSWISGVVNFRLNFSYRTNS